MAEAPLDPHRPTFHLMPPRGWMNEPHAPIQIGGRHHVFYQYNPVEADWANICWGHAVSDDLVHWEHLDVALDPAIVPTAPDGVWSGSSVRGDDDRLCLYFTAGDFGRSPNQAVARAVSEDSSFTSFLAAEHLLVEQPTNVPDWSDRTVFGEFRDPFVWRQGDEWFMLVGSGIDGQGGAALLFSSPDGLAWHQERPLLVGSAESWPKTGVMWELPVFLPIGPGPDGRPRHVLFVAPWWRGESEHHLEYVWHWVGVWDAPSRRFVPDDPAPRHFDHGAHLTGPSGTVLDDGRSILWTIAQDGRSRAEHLEADWAHNAGLPLQLALDAGGMLLVQPVTEVALLRGDQLVGLDHPSNDEAMAAVGAIGGLHLEIDLVVELGDEPLALEVRRSDDGREGTEIGLDPRTSEVWVDRSRSSLDASHRAPRRSGPVRGSLAHATLRVFLDGSMIEAYVNSVASITTRAYPISADATRLALTLPADARVVSLDAYALQPAFPTPTTTTKDVHAAAR